MRAAHASFTAVAARRLARPAATHYALSTLITATALLQHRMLGAEPVESGRAGGEVFHVVQARRRPRVLGYAVIAIGAARDGVGEASSRPIVDWPCADRWKADTE